MHYFTVNMEVSTPGKSDDTATLTAYLPSNGLDIPLNHSRPVVLVLPGGGYAITYDGEAEPIALKFAAEGACAFVLHYSVAPARFPQALCETLTAVRYIRDNAEQYGIDPGNIAVCGFSAGGHLAASAGVFWNREFLSPYLSKDREPYRPNKLILCYPVIKSSGPHHQGSFDCLLGQGAEHQTPELLSLVSLEKQVSRDTPPTFLWHTFEDPSVPPQNSLEFATALIEHGIPTELHLYPKGGHGLCLGSHVTSDIPFGRSHMTAEWIDKSVSFLFDKGIPSV